MPALSSTLEMILKHLELKDVYSLLIFPAVGYVLHLCDLLAISSLNLFTVGCIFLFPGLLIILRVFTPLYNFFFFLNRIQLPTDFKHPEKYNLKGSRNISIEFYSKVDKCKIVLGAWHILPEKYSTLPSLQELKDSTNHERNSAEEVFDNLLEEGDRPVILYAHGCGLNRAANHRTELYELLQKLQFHVITFDYRGFGDSTVRNPSEIRLVEDTIAVYRWILEKLHKHDSQATHPTPVYVWGHSLGTSVSIHSCALVGIECSLPSKMSDENCSIAQLRQPNGVILEAAFDNFSTEIQEHIFSIVHRWSPWFKWVKIILAEKDGLFPTDVYINYTPPPILMLHAEDDFIVPYRLGVNLFFSAVIGRGKQMGAIEFKNFDHSLGLGHLYICRSKLLSGLVSSFVKKYSKIAPPKLLEPEDKLRMMYPDDRLKVINTQFY